MKYSLLDAFLVWLGPMGITALIVGFVGLLAGLAYRINRSLVEREIADRINRADLASWDVPDGELITGGEALGSDYDKLTIRHNARMNELYRIKAIHERCLASSRRTRYSRSTLRKTR